MSASAAVIVVHTILSLDATWTRRQNPDSETTVMDSATPHSFAQDAISVPIEELVNICVRVPVKLSTEQEGKAAYCAGQCWLCLNENVVSGGPSLLFRTENGGLFQACWRFPLRLLRAVDPTGGDCFACYHFLRYTRLVSPPLHTHVKTARFGDTSWHLADNDSMNVIKMRLR